MRTNKKKEVTFENIDKRDIGSELVQIRLLKNHLSSDDTIFAEAFYNHIEDSNPSKEIQLKKIKKVLKDLSIKLGFDIEPAKELILIKHSHLNGVSFPIFKECLLQYFDKQEKILSTSFFIEENFDSNIQAVNKSNLFQNETNNIQENSSNELPRDNINFGPDYDVNLIILHRSLYILKRKFEMHEAEVLEIYSKYCEKNKMEYIIDVRNFSRVVEEILNKSNFSFAMIKKEGDLFRAELLNQIDKEKVRGIVNGLSTFMADHRRKYNTIMREKKEKKYLNSYIEDDGDNIDGHINNQQGENIAEVLNDKMSSSQIRNKDLNANEIKKNEKSNLKNLPQNAENLNQTNENDFNANYSINNNILQLRKELQTFFIEKIKNEDESTITNNNSNNISNLNHSSTDHKVKNLTRVEYILIEVLPLIIADFVHQNTSSIVIVETEDELRHELRTLFDKEIIQRLGESTKFDFDEENTEKLKELLYEKLNLDKNIKFYEDLLIKKQSTNENVSYITQMLQKMRNQKIWIEKKIKNIQEDNNTYNNFNSVIKPNLDEIEMKIVNKEFKEVSINDHSSSRKMNVSKIVPKKFLTKEEKRDIALKEIFYFYTRQHIFVGLKPNFDEIKESNDHLNLSEFSKFCKEFKIMLRKEKLVEVFKKTATNSIQMKFEEFLNACRSMSVKVNEEKKANIMKKISKFKKELKQLEIEKNKQIAEIKDTENKNLNSDDSGNFEKNIDHDEEINLNHMIPEFNENLPENFKSEKKLKISPNIIAPQEKNYSTKILNKKKSNAIKTLTEQLNENQIQEEILNLKIILKELNTKTYEQQIEEFYLNLEIDDEKVYRKKMKGFVLPFNIHEKNYRIPDDTLFKKSKKMDARTSEEIKRILQQRKEEREKERKETERIEKLSYLEQKKKLAQMNKKTIKDRERFNSDTETNYSCIKQKQTIIEKEKEMKLTWDQLEKMNYDHFISKREDDFNPVELFEGDEIDSDDEELLINLNKIKENSVLNDIEVDNSKSFNLNKINESKVINSEKINYEMVENKKKTTQQNPIKNSYSNIYNYNNAALLKEKMNYSKNNLNASEEKMKSLDYSLIQNKSKQSKNNQKSFHVKTEHKAKELEKNWVEKQAKLIQKYDELVKKSQEKVKKSTRKVKY